ncbi:MAG TPA: L-histidine N(alpha)-methyltransferase [Actinomycetota bacterium]|nr:L-histidine N(alpha)-methyltransferase [Actinomycetota bacterium]
MSPQGAVSVSGSPGLTSHLDPIELDLELRRDARKGLSAAGKSIPSKWFYDYTGSMLFDEITRLPEYYLTRSERQILQERAAAIVELSGAEAMVELGCGLSEKTRVLLDAFQGRSTLRRFVPFDVDGKILTQAAGELLDRYPNLEVQGIVGDFERHLTAIALPERTLVIFLGSTIGNLEPTQRRALFDRLSASLKPGDSFLLGVDLIKDVAIIEAAYNDSAGISAAFNLNMLSVLNDRLGGNFDRDGFRHVARFNPETEQMEMFLRSIRRQRARLQEICLDVDLAFGELIHTEISAKFRREGLEAELADAGLKPAQWWTDLDGYFALSLSTRS